MKKKQLTKAKHSPAKSHKQQVVISKGGRVLPMKNRTESKRTIADNPAFAQAVQNYEAGLRALQERKFDKAKALFQKVVAADSKELTDRAAVHLNTCSQHLEKQHTSFKSVEEHYDYSVSLMNQGDYVTAREHLEKILKQASKADYVLYGLAVLECLTSHFEESLRYLAQAIDVNQANRFQARNDSDFHNLAEDPRFTELLYPENGADYGSRR
jgi:tetratricopeptide (TPR) repeat protein